MPGCDIGQRCATGRVGAGKYSERDVVPYADVAGAARQMDHGKRDGHTAARASPERARVEGSSAGWEGAFDPAIDGGTSQERPVLDVSQGDGPARDRPGEF